MKTKAHFKGHAIHPMLVAFPIAFLTGALGADLIGRMMNWPRWYSTGAGLSAAGVIAGVVAAVPGLIDYFFAVPPRSSAKKRATYHMVVNLSAVGLFLLAFALRGPIDSVPAWSIIGIELLAVVLMTMGGWMGGTLVNRNFIGPEHRYTNKGKWQEQSFDASSGETIVVASTDDLGKDQMKLVRVNGKRIVIAETDSPSPGNPGEGQGEGSREAATRFTPTSTAKKPSPQPSPGVPGEGVVAPLPVPIG
jgi:uncharacterized membrane protein